MGAENQTKGRVSRREKKQATPTDFGTARSAGDLPGKHPAGRVVCYSAPVPPGFSPRGCKGRSPLHEITLILPLPAGKGVGGMGAGKKTKGKVGRREKKQATPTDSGTARSAGDLPGKPPNGHLHRRFSPCRLRLRRGDARGGAPCIRKLKISPFPPGRGARGWGQERKLKARLAGEKKSKPPQQIPERQGQPATCRASPPTGTYTAGSARAASGSGAGMQGAEPLA